MRFTGLRWRAEIRAVLAATSLLIFALPIEASKHPRYGGVLRVELRATEIQLDPRLWRDGSVDDAINQKLAALVFERLLSVDNYGRFQPQLAVEWTHDSSFRRWRFVLRDGVKYSDGTAMTASDMAEALQPLLPKGIAVSASGNGLLFHSERAQPDLLEILASSRCYVFRPESNGTLLGSGPFFIQPGMQKPVSAAVPAASNRIVFKANDNHWAGRPFLDEVDVTLGVLPLKALLDLQAGKADLMEIAPELMQRALQSNLRTSASWPLTLYALRFDPTASAAATASVRQSIEASLDRETMAGVLLQRQAEPAPALLPQWLSGYAFVFGMNANSEHGRQIRGASPASVAANAAALRLRVDAAGETPKLLGERVALNARQSGAPLIISGRQSTSPGSTDARPGAHLIAWRYTSLSPRIELAALSRSFGFDAPTPSGTAASDAEQLYAYERSILQERTLLPLVVVPDYTGLSTAVRDWMPSHWGEWNLADVWIEREGPATSDGSTTAPPNSFAGAHP